VGLDKAINQKKITFYDFFFPLGQVRVASADEDEVKDLPEFCRKYFGRS
jgi:hypothetical protein